MPIKINIKLILINLLDFSFKREIVTIKHAEIIVRITWIAKFKKLIFLIKANVIKENKIVIKYVKNNEGLYEIPMTNKIGKYIKMIVLVDGICR